MTDERDHEQPAPHQRRGPFPDETYEVAAGVAVAALTLPLGDVGGVAAAGLTPPAARALKAAHAKWIQNSEQNTQRMLDEGASVSNERVEEFIERVTENPRHVLCLVSAIEGARSTAYEGKIRLLGRALAAAAEEEDPALIDEEQMFIEAVRRLETPHVLLLRVIEKYTVLRPDEVEAVSEADLAREIGDYVGGRGILQPLLRPLESYGLARLHGAPDAWDGNIASDIPAGAGGSGRWVITLFGRRFLQRLAEVEEETPVIQ
ncbi:hypothetical protein ACIOFQ_05490 [[Kitasatospora] papulosa]|uniref:hypothetical protein n=1 Tax=[Kitasatospora] papulosa TaxID=1464011 RepID=UPI0037FAF6E0